MSDASMFLAFSKVIPKFSDKDKVYIVIEGIGLKIFDIKKLIRFILERIKLARAVGVPVGRHLGG